MSEVIEPTLWNRFMDISAKRGLSYDQALKFLMLEELSNIGYRLQNIDDSLMGLVTR